MPYGIQLSGRGEYRKWGGGEKEEGKVWRCNQLFIGKSPLSMLGFLKLPQCTVTDELSITTRVIYVVTRFQRDRRSKGYNKTRQYKTHERYEMIFSIGEIQILQTIYYLLMFGQDA